MALFMSLDFLFEPFRTMLAARHGNEFAERVFAARSQYHIENVTIMNDEELQQMGLFA